MINNETLRILEFDKILGVISGFVNSDATRSEIHNLCPLPHRREIEQRFGRIGEIRRLTQLGVPLRLTPFLDITLAMAMVRPTGAVLAPLELVVFLPVLRTLAVIARQFAYRTDIPLLQELAGPLTGFPAILEPLEAAIDKDGNILDTASKLLFELRGRKRGLTARIRKRLEEIVRERQTAIFLQDDFITQRGGRWVIPVRMDSKGMVPGVVHDVSNSGETAFMEPIEIIGLANELENLAAEEKAEQIRILRQICQWIREDLVGIEREFRALVQLDLHNSIARFADLLQAEVPAISEAPVIRLKEGRHPLLMLLQRERGRAEVVPLDLILGENCRGEACLAPTKTFGKSDTDIPMNATQVMVITGPNAGGKTIAIKTTGLLLLMALAGIPVPAASTSVFPMVDTLLVDIGDEQSIEESLSTFSAHVSRIAGILRDADSRTLVLLDELGTGTEPGQGAAIACAVLHDLQANGSLVLATTNLSDIIGFVHRTEGMVNAAMEFDRETFTPLYRLKSGEPGQSHALEIARRYGLPDRVIVFAQGMVSRLESDFHQLLAELKEMRLFHEEKLRELERREQQVAERELLLSEKTVEAQQLRNEALEKAWLEAKEIVQGAKRQVNAIVEEARQERSRLAKQRLDDASRLVAEKLRELRPDEHLTTDRLEEGMQVFVNSIGYDATIIAIDPRHGRLRVRAGRLELEIPLADAAPARGKAALAKKTSQRGKTEEPLSCELKIIGLRVDDALPEVERFLNRFSLEGGGEVRIIHGKGTGALMRAVRDYLDGHPLVAQFRKGEPFEGGDGATVVTLR
jgi:DNA mismatch repair protein MutS2